MVCDGDSEGEYGLEEEEDRAEQIEERPLIESEEAVHPRAGVNFGLIQERLQQSLDT